MQGTLPLSRYPPHHRAFHCSIHTKHFTFDKGAKEGTDHILSVNLDELKVMVTSIRNIEKALGSGIKKPSQSESKNISICRKSIVASRDIKEGELLSEDNLAIKRPGTGISPMRWDEVIGQKAKVKFMSDDLIKLI